jgi:hypothetical protein
MPGWNLYLLQKWQMYSKSHCCFHHMCICMQDQQSGGSKNPYDCHGLIVMTRYSDLHFLYWTTDSFFSISDLISSFLPIVVTRYFYMLSVSSTYFHPFPVPTIVGSLMFSYLSAPSVCFQHVLASPSTLQ